jgi:hypothetical protein
MKDAFQPAIDALLGDIDAMEHKIVETKKSINRLCELAGESLMFADLNEADRKRSLSALRADQFYGRVLTTAAREYLEMRNSANLGPATPREIYNALAEGGFKFETKNEDNAITNIRATLRKNSSIFHRLPNSEYGLLAWYPNAKPVRDIDEDEPARKPPRSSVRHKAPKAKRSGKSKVALGPIALELMADGGAWTTDRLKTEAIERGIAGVDESTNKMSFHGVLLGLSKKGTVEPAPGGGWRLVRMRLGQAADVVPIKGAA